MINFLDLHCQGCLCSHEEALWTFEHFCVSSTVVQWSRDCRIFISRESVVAGQTIRYTPWPVTK